MKKRIVSFLLTVIMFISIVPVTVLAEEHTHDGANFSPWIPSEHDNAVLPNESGNWYLTENVTLTDSWTISSSVFLCLNSMAINLNGHNINVTSGSRLCIYDCGNVEHKGYVKDGIWYLSDKDPLDEGETAKIISGGVITNGSAKNGGAINIASGCSALIYGGTFAGNTATNGGAIYTEGPLGLNGGTFIYNSASENGGGVFANGDVMRVFGSSSSVDISFNKAKNGGGIYNIGATNLSGEMILTNNVASNNGGAICNDSGSAKFSFGDAAHPIQIVDNTATNGGGVYNAGEFGLNKGTIIDCIAINGGGLYNCTGARSEIVGSTFQDCDAAGDDNSSGGGIYNEVHGGNDFKTVSMTSTTIENCSATKYGGGIYNEGSIGLSSVNITSNNVTSSSGLGGGIYNKNDSFLAVGGATNVTTNKKEGTDTSDVYLPSGAKLTVGSGVDVPAPTAAMSVGVMMETPGVFTTNEAVDCKDYFLAENEGLVVVYTDDNELKMILPVALNTTTDKYYESLAEAVEEVANDQTLLLKADNAENITVSKTIKFSIDADTFTNSAVLTAGSGYTVTKTGDNPTTYDFKPVQNPDPTPTNTGYIVPNTCVK